MSNMHGNINVYGIPATYQKMSNININLNQKNIKYALEKSVFNVPNYISSA